MIDYKVGQKLWCHTRYSRDVDVRVSAIGRIWIQLVDCATDRHYGRVRHNSTSVDGSQDRLYESKEAFESERAQEKAWRIFIERVRLQTSRPPNLSEEGLAQATALLFGAS
jgi:hypothetical protein